jgi:hypothetical protein
VPATNPATTFFVIIVPTPPGLGSVREWDTRRAANGTVVIVTGGRRDYSGTVPWRPSELRYRIGGISSR